MLLDTFKLGKSTEEDNIYYVIEGITGTLASVPYREVDTVDLERVAVALRIDLQRWHGATEKVRLRMRKVGSRVVAELIEFADAWASLGGAVREQVKNVLDGKWDEHSVNPMAIKLAFECMGGFNDEIFVVMAGYLEKQRENGWDG